MERSASIQAPPEKVFANIADFRRWPLWSPWEGRDPQMKRALSGAESGAGAVYAWEGNRQVGQGRMEILEATAPALVRIKLDFLKPFEAHNVAEYTLQREGAGTRVTWAMHGPQPFLMKLMGFFMSMDRMVGKDFEAGLARLKQVSERKE